MKQLTIGTANWDLYLTDTGALSSEPKLGTGAESSYFGDRDHIKRLMAAGYWSEDTIWLDAGLEYMSGLHSALYQDSKGDRFAILRFTR